MKTVVWNGYEMHLRSKQIVKDNKTNTANDVMSICVLYTNVTSGM